MRGAHWTAAERNVRPVELIGPQEAPQPPGPVPARPARMPVVTFFTPSDYIMEQNFVAGDIEYPHFAFIPAGGMTPDRERSNIEVPAAVAYGSLFATDTQPYGYG